MFNLILHFVICPSDPIKHRTGENSAKGNSSDHTSESSDKPSATRPVRAGSVELPFKLRKTNAAEQQTVESPGKDYSSSEI